MNQSNKDHLEHVLVTGANGFLGSEVIRQTTKAELTVRATDKNEASCLPEVDYRRADILYPGGLKPILNGIECLIHAAGLAHIYNRNQANAALFKAVNEIGTVNVASAAAEAGVQHFVLISSVSVYGPFTYGVYDEETPCFPVGPYAESKYQAEQRTIEVAQKSGMNLAILRLATAYGEGDPGNVCRLMKAIDRGRFLWIGSGLNRKSLIHREDVARACLAVLKNPREGINIYNVSAPPCTMKEVVEGLSTALGRRIPRFHIPASMALYSSSIAKIIPLGKGKFSNLHATIKKWVEDGVYDSTKFETTFGFKTKVSLADGLQRQVVWYKQQRL